MILIRKLFYAVVLGCVLAFISYYILNLSLFYFNQHNYEVKDVNQVTEQDDGMFGFQSIPQENKVGQCESCSITVPNVIIQYGSKRTATTLQFQILCLMMVFIHEDEINNVGCLFHNKTVNKYVVVKTHDFLKLPISVPSNSWIFMTSSDALQVREKLILNYVRRKVKERNITIPYVVDIEMVSKRGHYIAYDYQYLFGISDEKMQYIVEYLRYWDILRICCGRQMSAVWRNRLLSNVSHSKHQNPHSPTYPACEMYNISQVELLLLNTYVCKKFGHIASLRNVIGKPSIRDDKLDGSYCDRCNANITAKRIQFNHRCA